MRTHYPPAKTHNPPPKIARQGPSSTQKAMTHHSAEESQRRHPPTHASHHPRCHHPATHETPPSCSTTHQLAEWSTGPRRWPGKTGHVDHSAYWSDVGAVVSTRGRTRCDDALGRWWWHVRPAPATASEPLRPGVSLLLWTTTLLPRSHHHSGAPLHQSPAPALLPAHSVFTYHPSSTTHHPSPTTHHPWPRHPPPTTQQQPHTTAP